MALGTREMLLVIRARDEASRVLGRMSNQLRDMDRGALQAANDMINRGGAMVSLGAGITAIGASGIALLADMTQAAADYDHAASRALTQTADIQASLEDLKKIGRDVARDIPAPFEKMQDSLFTIFSTIDTDLPGAERALREFAQSAVAGQTDLQQVTEGSLQVLNGFGLGIDEVRRVSDVMFELVAEGVGSFEEFVSNMGKAVPSAQRMGQSVEGLAGMMAFMTRNGLSGAMAATSAARAFDLLANQKVIDRMHEFGVEVKDAQGEFRPMAAIVEDLGKKMATMTAPERAAALTNLFKGSGNNVQARRFFDLAIPGFQSLNELTGEMVDSSGAMQRAYDIMLKSPQTAAQELTNRYEVLKTEIGDKLLPVKMRLFEVLGWLLDLWEKIPGPVQTAIVYFVAITSAILTLSGIVTIAAGAWLIFSGTMAMFGIAAGTAVLAIGSIIVAFAAIGVGVYLVIKYWDEIKDATISTWNTIKKWFEDNLQPQIDAVVEFADTIWQTIQTAWDEVVRVFNEAMGDIQKEWAKFVELAAPARELWNNIFPYVKKGFSVLKALFSAGLKVIQFLWEFFIQPIIDGVSLVFTGIGNIIEGALQFIQGILSFFLNLFTGNWSEAWNGLLEAFKGIGKMLLGAIQALFGAIWTWLSVTALGKIFSILKGAVMGLLNLGKAMFTGLWNGIKSIAGTIWGWVSGFLGRMISPITGFVSRMFTAGLELLLGFLNGIKNKAVAVWEWFTSLPGTIWTKVEDAATWIVDSGKALIEGFWEGIKNGASWLWEKIKGWLGDLWGDIKGWFGISSPSKEAAKLGRFVVQGFAQGITGTAKQATAAARSMSEKVFSELAQRHPGISAAAGNRILHAVDVYDNRLVQIAARREQVAKALKTANSRLVAAIKVRDKYASEVATKAQEFAQITNLDAAGGDLAEQLRDRLQKITDFRANMSKLLSMGLSKTMYDQLIQAGVESGGALAESLVADGADSVRALSTIQAQIDAASKGLGTDAGNTLYGAGVQAATGLVRGLQSQATALARQARSTANVLVAEIKRALGVRSPSAVFADIGVQSMLGMAQGLLSAAPTAASAAATAAGMVSDSFNSSLTMSSLGADAVSGGRGGNGRRPGDDTPPASGPTVPITIYTNEINPLQHATEIGAMVAETVG